MWCCSRRVCVVCLEMFSEGYEEMWYLCYSSRLVLKETTKLSYQRLRFTQANSTTHHHHATVFAPPSRNYQSSSHIGALVSPTHIHPIPRALVLAPTTSSVTPSFLPCHRCTIHTIDNRWPESMRLGKHEARKLRQRFHQLPGDHRCPLRPTGQLSARPTCD